MESIKQVILIRRDLKMRRGKEIAQGAHSAMQFLTEPIINRKPLELSEAEAYWLMQGMAKICLQVQSEQELIKLHEQALAAGLKSYVIRDSGRTEFGGVPTVTACAIGPDRADSIDAVTGHLSLY